MFFLRKLVIYLFGLLNLLLFYLILTQTERGAYWASLIVLILFLVIKFIAGQKAPGKEIFIFFSLILGFILPSILFLLIVENLSLNYFLIFLASGASVFYLELLLRHWQAPEKYQPFSIVQFFSFIFLLSLFFAASGLFAIQVFLTLSFGWLALILSLLSFILVCQTFWLNKLEVKKYSPYALIIFVIIFEASALLSWWPISYYVKGLLITVFYFLLINLTLRSIKQIWEKRKALAYVVASVLIVVASLVTARWT